MENEGARQTPGSFFLPFFACCGSRFIGDALHPTASHSQRTHLPSPPPSPDITQNPLNQPLVIPIRGSHHGRKLRILLFPCAPQTLFHVRAGPTMALTFEWDAAKARSNAAKHGISFELACQAFYDLNRIDELHRVHGSEYRYRVIGFAAGRLLFLVYTWRGQNIRLISARGALRNELFSYSNHRHLHPRS
jgi:uncharacterized DUF497 family protein